LLTWPTFTSITFDFALKSQGRLFTLVSNLTLTTLLRTILGALFEIWVVPPKPVTLQNKSYKNIKGRKVLNVQNQENKELILSIDCDTNELDVRIPGRKWMGSKPANEEFENNLINDFCLNF